jgi:hypothetical protein
MHIVETAGQPYRPSTIFGLRRRNFWVLVAILLVAVDAALGGSIGGALAVRNAVYRVFRKTYCTAPYIPRSKSNLYTLEASSTSTFSNSPPAPSSNAAGTSLRAGAAYTTLSPSVVSLIDNLCPDTPTFPSFNDDTYNCTHGRDASAMHIPTSAQRLHIYFDSASLHAVW